MRRWWLCLFWIGCGQEQVGPGPIKLSISASTTAPGEAERVTLNAVHTGGGNDISYTWTQVSPPTPLGTFSSAASDSTQFKVPDLCADAVFVLKVAARDTFGQTAEATVELAAVNSNDPFGINGPIVTDAASKLAGETFRMSISASGPGCGPKYVWTQEGMSGGAFESSTDAANATWRAPATPGTYSFRVNVSDEAGVMSDSRTVQLTVTQPVWNDVKVLFDNCTGCHDGDTNSGGGVDFDGPELEPTLMGTSHVTSNNLCDGQPYLATDPASSVLHKRLTGTTCGPQMPRNNASFKDANANLIIRLESWLRAGASF